MKLKMSINTELIYASIATVHQDSCALRNSPNTDSGERDSLSDGGGGVIVFLTFHEEILKKVTLGQRWFESVLQVMI